MEIKKLISLCKLYVETQNNKQREKILREIYKAGKNRGFTFPTILLAPGLPRVEKKNAIYPDGRVVRLTEVSRVQ